MSLDILISREGSYSTRRHNDTIDIVIYLAYSVWKIIKLEESDTKSNVDINYWNVPSCLIILDSVTCRVDPQMINVRGYYQDNNIFVPMCIARPRNALTINFQFMTALRTFYLRVNRKHYHVVVTITVRDEVEPASYRLCQ